TRFSRDWSSDVCSSDLTVVNRSLRVSCNQCANFFHSRYLFVCIFLYTLAFIPLPFKYYTLILMYSTILLSFLHFIHSLLLQLFRSEERRVGKDCRSQLS